MYDSKSDTAFNDIDTELLQGCHDIDVDLHISEIMIQVLTCMHVTNMDAMYVQIVEQVDSTEVIQRA